MTWLLLPEASSVPCWGWETIVYLGVAESFHALEVSFTVVASPDWVLVDCASASKPGMIVASVAYAGSLASGTSLITPVGLTSSRSQYSPGATLEASTH